MADILRILKLTLFLKVLPFYFLMGGSSKAIL